MFPLLDLKMPSSALRVSLIQSPCLFVKQQCPPPPPPPLAISLKVNVKKKMHFKLSPLIGWIALRKMNTYFGVSSKYFQ